jgi:uncharacterized Zn-finger protein
MSLGSGIRDPEKTYLGSRIQGSKRPRIRIRNTDNRDDTSDNALTAAGQLSAKNSFNCQLCSKSFTSEGRLRYHTGKHTNKKPLSCTQCDKTFSGSSVLRVHLRTHTGEKPHSCSHCKKSFYPAGGSQRPFKDSHW